MFRSTNESPSITTCQNQLTPASWLDRPALLLRKNLLAINPLTAAEQIAVINSLTAAEQTALMKIAKHYAKVRIQFDPENLVHDAICRVLDGRRAWPKEVPATVFLGGVVRIIAWEWESDLPDPEINTGDEGAGGRGTLAKIDVMKIIALFDDESRRATDRAASITASAAAGAATLMPRIRRR